MNDNAQKRKLLIAIALIVCVILILSAAAFVFHVRAHREYVKSQMETFDIIIDDVASWGKIESMEYAVCGEKTFIEPYEDNDGVVLWMEKISTPKQLLTSKGPPCAVEILITKEGKKVRYPADQLFDCPDCSGWHHYKIIGNTAVYTYSP